MAVFGKKSLEDILGSFNKAVADLTTLSADNRASKEENDKRVAELNAESRDLVAEADKADSVKANIQKLLGA